tara:strand:+ start:37 stop:486 length:450 start_codon:yes stop_codon:yes gene_type:complete
MKNKDTKIKFPISEFKIDFVLRVTETSNAKCRKVYARSKKDALEQIEGEFPYHEVLVLENKQVDFKNEDLLRFRCENIDESKDEVPVLQIVTALDIHHADLIFKDSLREMNMPVMKTHIVEEGYFYSKLHECLTDDEVQTEIAKEKGVV